jgi:hypothetical protein
MREKVGPAVVNVEKPGRLRLRSPSLFSGEAER